MSYMRKYWSLTGVFLLLVGVLFSCTDRRKPDLSNAFRSMSYARYFQVDSTPGTIRRIALLPPSGKGEKQVYYLLPQGENPKKMPSGTSNIIRVPVGKVVVFSATHIGMLSELGENELIAAVDRKGNIYDTIVRKGVEEGRIQELGEAERASVEKILELKPDLVLVTGMGSIPGSWSELAAAGIPVLPTYGWLESHPLGRAEWIKVFGLLTGDEDKSYEIFRHTVESYGKLIQMSNRVKDRPSVLAGQMWKSIWYAPGGQSYFGQLFRDAAGDYYWSKTGQTGSLSLDFEEVLMHQSDAEVWVNPGRVSSIGELLSADERLRAFHCVRMGNVFVYSKKQHPDGGNAFWEEGFVRPDRILSDLIKIFHPEINKEEEFYFYRKLKP